MKGEMNTRKGGQNPSPGIRQDGDIGSRQLVLIKPDDLADIDRPPEIEGPGQWYPWLRRYIPQVGKYIRHGDGKLTRSGVAGNLDMMAFQDMGQGGNREIVCFSHQAFPVLHGHLHERPACQLVQPVLGITKQENEFYPGFLIERRAVFDRFYLLHLSVFGGMKGYNKVPLPTAHIQFVVDIF